jgi:transposase
VIRFLKHLRRHLRRPLLVVWDGAPIHRSNLVQHFLASTRRAIIVERLPTYAPELNPAEGIFGYLKERKLGNFCPDSIAELRVVAARRLSAMRHRKKLVRGFWKLAQLYQ